MIPRPLPRRRRHALVRSLTVGLPLGLCTLLLGGCAFGPPSGVDQGAPPNLPRPTPSVTGGDDLDPDGVVATVIATDLNIPWDLTFLPDGGALVTERSAQEIVKVGPAVDSQGNLTVSPVATFHDAATTGEGGMLGIAVSPHYATDSTVFVYYTTATDNRIVSLRLGHKPTPILTGIPKAATDNGGHLAFGPDGYLYASTGDAQVAANAANLKSLSGKILRMTTAGKPAPGNPFARSLVWSYGHRNVEGFTWDGSGHLLATEFGPDTWDEINVITKGHNYGWPSAAGLAGRAGLVDPVEQFPVADASCAGAAMSGTILVAACLRGERVWLTRFTAHGTPLGSPVAALMGQYGRLRAAQAAPDGSVWLTTSNLDGKLAPRTGDDKIIRLVIQTGGGVSKA